LSKYGILELENRQRQLRQVFIANELFLDLINADQNLKKPPPPKQKPLAQTIHPTKESGFSLPSKPASNILINRIHSVTIRQPT
jgi:hypothetical protein